MITTVVRSVRSSNRASSSSSVPEPAISLEIDDLSFALPAEFPRRACVVLAVWLIPEDCRVADVRFCAPVLKPCQEGLINQPRDKDRL